MVWEAKLNNSHVDDYLNSIPNKALTKQCVETVRSLQSQSEF